MEELPLVVTSPEGRRACVCVCSSATIVAPPLSTLTVSPPFNRQNALITIHGTWLNAIVRKERLRTDDDSACAFSHTTAGVAAPYKRNGLISSRVKASSHSLSAIHSFMYRN